MTQTHDKSIDEYQDRTLGELVDLAERFETVQFACVEPLKHVMQTERCNCGTHGKPDTCLWCNAAVAWKALWPHHRVPYEKPGQDQ